MRAMPSAVLIEILSLALVQVPAVAGPTGGSLAPLGVVLTAEQVHAWPDLIYSGATIYDDDRLQTPSGGRLLARLGSGQMALRENSSVIVHSAPRGFSAELESGSVVVSSGKGQSFQVMADGATIRPLHEQPTSAQITMLNSKELILTSTRGTLEVTIAGEVKMVESGTSYRMEVEAGESEAGPQSSTTPGPGRSHFLKIIVPAGVAATLIIIRALESGDRL